MVKDIFKSLNSIHRDSNLTLEEKYLLTILIKYHNVTDGYSYPTYEVLLSECSTSRRSKISKMIKGLKEKGYIEVVKVKGNKSHYYIKKHLFFTENINSNKKQNSTDESNRETPVSEEVENENDTIKPFIVSDWKESGVQLEISEYSTEHQQKISLVLKQGIKLSQKQEFLIGEMDLEALRKAIHEFKKKKGKYFSLLLSLYIDQAEEAGVYVSRDIEKYLKGSYIRLTPEERETQEALRELELYGVPYGA